MRTANTRTSRVLVVDTQALLVGAIDANHEQHAGFVRGFDNGFVAIVRRLMTTGVLIDGQRPLNAE